MKLQVRLKSIIYLSWTLFLISFWRKVSAEQQQHSRQKRLLWITTDGRLALPPGTTLVVAPSLGLPFVRYPPDGFFSNLSISLPFTINFNQLGLTDNENPYGILPPLLSRSMARSAGGILANYIGSFLNHRRKRRSLDEKPPELPPNHKFAFHGGERAILFTVIEDFLESFGMNGKACLLRAICEIHAHPLQNYGIFGEIAKLFFTASKSPFANLLNEYVEAENAGSGKSGPAECWPYMKDCPKSLFKSRHNHYSKENEENEIHQENPPMDKVVYEPSIRNM